ncbi:MAG TPA: pyridoxal phosphate-dependent aminotransferase [Polyangiales bacterium]|jgi:aspartate/methionine/tyrosine aminotransferase|nr:pyridoxal phosphate-dependent aminotransferase [Polyangiales bacterium]
MFAKRTQEVEPFLAMEVMERGMAMAREGSSIVQLGVGEPDFDAPPEAVQAAVDSLQSGETHYTDSRGVFSLREAIAEDCEARRGVTVSPDQVVVTSGTSPAILLCLNLLVDTGDEVILATPHYPCYPNMIAVCGGTPVLVPTGPEDGFVIDVARVRAAVTPRTRAILLASPANPTGAVQPREVIEGLSDLGIPILSDEIYDGLTYDGARVTSPLQFTEQCYVLDGFSKRYAMTGFRLGYLIAPPIAMRPLQSLMQSFFISTSQFVQQAGLAALAHGAEHVERMRQEYAARRRIMVDGLRDMGLSIPIDPPGAFYVLVDMRHFGRDSLTLAFDILEKAQVALGPGRDFGEAAEGFVRFSFATSRNQIEEGLRRLARALPEL